MSGYPPTTLIEISIDLDRCQGAQHCMYLAPDAFDIGPDGMSFAHRPTPITDPDLAITVAAECPNHAVQLSLDGERVV